MSIDNRFRKTARAFLSGAGLVLSAVAPPALAETGSAGSSPVLTIGVNEAAGSS